jgi:hypothetical protein
VVSIPGRAEEFVTESEDEDVLDHLLTQIVVNAVELVLGPVWRERALKFAGAGKIFAEGLLDLFLRLAA